MLDRIVSNAPAYLLIAVRCFAVVMTLPFFSIKIVPRIAKVALAGYIAYILFPHVDFSMYSSFYGEDGAFSLQYIALLLGEGLIGIITGFSVSIIFAAFSTAGQFFAFQMGFSASEVYDSLSQVENPLMGQFFNLIAMLIFLQNKWALLLFSRGLVASFDSLNVFGLIASRDVMLNFLLKGLTGLFANAFIIALPIMGTLLLISVSMGILSKAAPQMNLMSEGFPIMILTTFFVITVIMPQLFDYFSSAFYSSFSKIQDVFATISKNGGAI